ncbi:MAG: glycosyltransferase family 39 protein [Pyrinomonadaceae bacterium]
MTSQFSKYRIILITFLALLLRVVYLLYKGPSLYSDSEEYLSLGNSLLRYWTLGFESLPYHSTAFRPPGYSFLIAPFLFFEHAPWLISLAQALIGALTVYFTFLLAKKYFGVRVATLASILLAFEPLSVHFTSIVMSETIFTFLVVSGVYSLVSNKPIVSGLLFGSATLTRPVMLPVVVAFLLIAVFSKSKSVRRSLFLSSAISVLLVSVWTIRNAVLLREFIPVSSTGYGYNLLCGTIDVPMIQDEGWAAVAADPAIKERRERLIEGWTESQTDKALAKIAVRRILDNPSNWLRIRTKQYTRLYIDSAPYILGKNNITFRQALDNGNLYFLGYKLLLVSRIFVALFLSLFAIFFLRRRLRELSIFLAFPVILALMHIPLWTEVRYILPIIPFLCILSAYTIVRTYNFLVAVFNIGDKPFGET